MRSFTRGSHQCGGCKSEMIHHEASLDTDKGSECASCFAPSVVTNVRIYLLEGIPDTHVSLCSTLFYMGGIFAAGLLFHDAPKNKLDVPHGTGNSSPFVIIFRKANVKVVRYGSASIVSYQLH
jgi:hypothetical protein